MPWFGAIDLWALSGLAEYVVPDDVEWNKDKSLVEESGYNEFEDLVTSE